MKDENVLKILPSYGFYRTLDGRLENNNLLEDHYIDISKMI